MLFRKISFLVPALWVALGAPVLAGAASDLIGQGEAQLKEGRFEEAIATLQEAVATDPGSSLALTRLGGAQVLKQEYAAGIESFKRAISLDAKNADAFLGMAVAYLHSGRYALARAALEEAKRIDPSKRAEVDKLIAWIDERSADRHP
jgi:tetratricopeptide (TPR) repeat protein